MSIEQILIDHAEDVVVPVTYSSRLEGGAVVATRLSLLAFDVACLVAAEQGADALVIAGEQSWKESRRTTGDALVDELPEGAPNPIILRNHDNRLINTAFQMSKLGDSLEARHRITLVGWGFHKNRVLDNLVRLAPDLDINDTDYVAVDGVLDDLWESAGLWDGDHARMEQAFADRYGFNEGVGWPEVRDRGIAEFTAREQRIAMRALHGLSKSGLLAKAVSTIYMVGRFDELNPDGSAYMKRTS